MVDYYNPNKKKRLPPLRIVLLVAGGLVAGFLLLRVFLVPFKVFHPSMEPSMKPGDRLVFFRFGSPARDDVILLSGPSQPERNLIKRVIGLPGERIEIRNRVLYINGKSVSEPERLSGVEELPVHFSYRDSMPMVRLGDGEYFLMNDNFLMGYDSRTFGPVKRESIRGVMLFHLNF